MISSMRCSSFLLRTSVLSSWCVPARLPRPLPSAMEVRREDTKAPEVAGEGCLGPVEVEVVVGGIVLVLVGGSIVVGVVVV